MNLHSEELLTKLDLITMCKKMGLVVFCWGDDNNNADNIRSLRKYKADGIIYDRSVQVERIGARIYNCLGNVVVQIA